MITQTAPAPEPSPHSVAPAEPAGHPATDVVQ